MTHTYKIKSHVHNKEAFIAGPWQEHMSWDQMLKVRERTLGRPSLKGKRVSAGFLKDWYGVPTVYRFALEVEHCGDTLTFVVWAVRE